MRRLMTFPCGGETLVGAIDDAAGSIGVLIVAGGNEIRVGPHRGMAALAARLAAQGAPVMRYDRRGTGDSSGTNTGFAGARDDLVAAAAAFRREMPQIVRIVGFGNCDGATTLALFGRVAGIDRLVLANPWLADEQDALPAAAAIRSRYRQQIGSPVAWSRLVGGRIDLPKLVKGFKKILANPRHHLPMLAAIAAWRTDASIVLARGDGTAIAYADAARRSKVMLDTTMIDTPSHSFAGTGHIDALATAILPAIR